VDYFTASRFLLSVSAVHVLKTRSPRRGAFDSYTRLWGTFPVDGFMRSMTPQAIRGSRFHILAHSARTPEMRCVRPARQSVLR